MVEILKEIQSFLQQKINHAAWHSFLTGRLQKTEKMIQEGYWIPSLDLPLLISSGLNIPHREARLLAMTSTFIYLGADLLDDLHDQELISPSHNISPADITLLSATLLTVFPVLTLLDLQTEAETKLKLQETVALSLMKMSVGQKQDISFTHKKYVSLEEVKQSIQAKSGEELALASGLTAQLAKVSSSQQKSYEDFGRYLGTALQISSDFYEVMWAPLSHDLKRGARSLPIAFCLEKFDGSDRDQLIRLLQIAPSDTKHLESLRRILAESGSLDYTALVLEDFCQRSLEILESLDLTAKIKIHLKNKIQSVSLLQTNSDLLVFEGIQHSHNNHERGIQMA